MRVIIVGAGYGGLSAAIACRRQGFDVICFEQAPEFMRVTSLLEQADLEAR
jgi:salicylate hydroxylase